MQLSQFGHRRDVFVELFLSLLDSFARLDFRLLVFCAFLGSTVQLRSFPTTSEFGLWELPDRLGHWIRVLSGYQEFWLRTAMSVFRTVGLVKTSLPLVLLTVSATLRTADAEGFRYPLAVAADRDNTVFVADRNLPGIWKIESGVRSVFYQALKTFRTPLNAVRCLTLDHEGHLLAGDSSTRDVYRFVGDNPPVPLTGGKIGIPMAIAVAADGTIYTADLELHRIWKMPPQGSSTPQEFAVINSPRGLALDPDGNLWVLSTSAQEGQIQQVRPDGTIHPFIRNHPFHLPHNIVRTADGAFFVTDNYNHCVWRVSATGHCEEWVKGPPLDRPVGLCRLQDDLLIADPHIKTLHRLAPDRRLSVFAGPGE